MDDILENIKIKERQSYNYISFDLITAVDPGQIKDFTCHYKINEDRNVPNDLSYIPFASVKQAQDNARERVETIIDELFSKKDIEKLKTTNREN